jgi:signal transduction histidine kinase
MLPDFRVRQRDYLLEITRALTQDLDLDRLLGRILGISIEMLSGMGGLIALRSEDGKWQIQVSQGLAPSFLEFLGPSLAEIPAENIATQNELPELGRRMNELAEAASMGRITSVGLALMTRQKVLGGIFIFRNIPGLFSSNDRALLASFADQAAIAVQNAQLYQQSLNETRRTKALIENAADGILILDPDLTITLANAALNRMIPGGSPVIGKAHSEVICWSKKPDSLQLEDAIAGGWPLTPNATLYVEGDLLCEGTDSPPLPIGITYAPMLSAAGALQSIIATVRDISHFREADELKSTFISIVSHELKTPVALIKGYVSTLRREDANWDPRVVDESLKVIEEEADHLGDLIDDLLDASRLQANSVSLKKSEVFLPEMVDRLEKRFQTQTSQHHLSSNFAPDFPVVIADEKRMEQVITNLLSNAIKYTSGGKIVIEGHVNNQNAIICVSDEGPGINPEDLPHVFDRFYRGPAQARKTKGAGLGLYLAKAILEAHGGKIWVDSGAVEGARICFSIPLNSQ